MSIKRKTRNLPAMKERERANQISFFGPVYQNDSNPMNDDESDDDEVSTNAGSRQTKDESNETLDAASTRHETMEALDIDQATDISTAKIVIRIKQIQNSIHQAQTMLDSMEKFKHIVPGSEEQYEKLRIIVANLEKQKADYVNLLNLISLTSEERSTLVNQMTESYRTMPPDMDEQSNEEEEEEDDDEDEENDLSPRRNVRSPVRPRIESKIGFLPQAITPTIPPTINSSDNEQNNRHDNSNYDSLVGSLKSDTINWKDQQSTTGDEASDVESEKEIERNLMLQKEQLRALQGQKRALLALKKRSEQRLHEQQQLINKKTNDVKEQPSENDLLSDINNLRDRLKLLRNLYDQKHQVEVQQLKSSEKKPTPAPTENRQKNLQHVRDQLDELEQIVTYYQLDLMDQPEEETIVYEENPIQPDDVQRLKTLMMQQKQHPSPPATTKHETIPEPLEKLSNELTAKRLELEQAKTALSRLQQMVKTIEPDECSSSVRSTPIQSASKKTTNSSIAHPSNGNSYPSASSQQTLPKAKASLLSSILSPQVNEQQHKSLPTTSTYADATMAAQHREIERLVESRQRLHTLKDQIASLHQSMTTPPLPSKNDSAHAVSVVDHRSKNNAVELREEIDSYEHRLNNSRNLRLSYLPDPQDGGEGEEEEEDDDDDSELYRFECESGDGEEIDDDSDKEVQSRVKQGNFHAPEDIVAEHEQRLLNTQPNSTDELSSQMREVCRCLSTFIQEQKSFNRHIEEHLGATKSTSPAPPPPAPPTINAVDPVFNQLQQQVLTQGLIVNLNTAYREIAVLQSEINALQSENDRLTSSLSSYDGQYQYRPQTYSRNDSKDSIYSFNQVKPVRPQPRSRFDDHLQQQNHLASNKNKFENSSKTSFNSQSTGKQTAIHLNKQDMETTPNKHERNATFTSERFSSPQTMHFHSKQLSDKYPSPSIHHRHSPKENLPKSFIIRRRPLSDDSGDDHLLKSQLFHYEQPTATFNHNHVEDEDDDEDDDDSELEQEKNELSATIFNIQPSAYHTSTTHDLDNVDVQTLDLQVKSIMVQLIPFLRLHINDTFNQTILNHIRERILFLFKQQPDSARLVHHFQNQFSQSLGKTIEKYCGTTIRDCAADLIRDISDVAFDELIKYKVFENAHQLQTITTNDTQSDNKQQDDDSNLYDSSMEQYTQQASLVDDGENENKYRIELAESESRPLMLIGSDEEDNDSDQEENKDSELQTAVSLQETQLISNDVTSSTDLNSNGHEYVLVNRSTSNAVQSPEPQEKENEQVVQS